MTTVTLPYLLADFISPPKPVQAPKLTNPPNPEDPSWITVRAEVHRLLGALGTTTDEIVQTLTQQGIRGAVGSAEFCPLATYLRGKTQLRVMVTQYAVYLSPRGNGLCHRFADLSKEVSLFVKAFDNRWYPQLVAK